MLLFAGIDGGGSKTLAVVVNELGQEVGRGFAPDSNYQVLMTHGHSAQRAAEIAAQRAFEAISRALPAECAGPVAAFAGLAGANDPSDLILMHTALADTKFCQPHKFQLVNDAELILYGLDRMQGLGLIAGTGSIAVGRDSSGKKGRAGGWGYILGDEGSGYALGRATLQAIVQAADGRGPATKLLPLVLNEWYLARPEDLLKAVYNDLDNRNRRIAQLARLVFVAARENDLVAQKLVKKAASALASAVMAVYQQLDFADKPAPALGLGGGLLLHTPELKNTMLKELEQLGLKPTKVVEIEEPAKAAALACRQYCLQEATSK